MYVLCYFYAVEVNLFVGWFCFLNDNSLFVVAWAVIIDTAFHCAGVLYFSYHELLTHQFTSLPSWQTHLRVASFPPEMAREGSSCKSTCSAPLEFQGLGWDEEQLRSTLLSPYSPLGDFVASVIIWFKSNRRRLNKSKASQTVLVWLKVS